MTKEITQRVLEIMELLTEIKSTLNEILKILKNIENETAERQKVRGKYYGKVY